MLSRTRGFWGEAVMGAQRIAAGLISALARACGAAAMGAPIDPGARPVEIAQDNSKYWTGNATYSKGSDGKETWTYPDKSTAVRDKTGKTEYRDPKGSLVETRQITSNDTATY